MCLQNLEQKLYLKKKIDPYEVTGADISTVKCIANIYDL